MNEEELGILAKAADADWQYIQPSIMGTLFERALEPEQRSQLGAHYTSEDDIRTLVEPVLMAPLRREWSTLKGELAAATRKRKVSKEQRDKLSNFLKKLAATTVLDPACGSGNFLYVSLQLLLDLEKEVITFANMLDLEFKPKVTVQQLKAIEINPYAYELAQVSVQIGFLQWRRENGFDNDRTPVLQVLDGFENKDALLHETFRKKPKNLKKAREEEHGHQDELFKVYVERAWPDAEVIVGNPPFLGDKFMRRELGDGYVEELRGIYGNRIPGQSDFCCYWFEKARDLIEHGKCKRAGLLATQGIRGGANREVLKRIKETGDIFFAESDRPWVLAGASVHVSMVGFGKDKGPNPILDGKPVSSINANLSTATDTVAASQISANREISFIGAAVHGPFSIPTEKAVEFLHDPNAKGVPNSDVIRPWANALTITQREKDLWIVDVPPDFRVEDAAYYEGPFKYLSETVLPVRQANRRAMRAKNWWLLGDPQKSMRAALAGLPRFLITPRVSKHRIFVWSPPEQLTTDAAVAFASDSDFLFGVLHSRFHEIWALKLGTRLETRPRYTPSTCVETFPFPRSTPTQETAIAAAARELNELRERWLNPPEWTVEKVLEFPGTQGGPWDRYIDAASVDAKTGIGTVRYPRLEPKDADCAAKLKKRTLTNLYNERPAWLDLAHKKLDATVAAAYGWPADLSDEQILEKLLALNLERAAEEARQSKPPAKKAQRSKAESELI